MLADDTQVDLHDLRRRSARCCGPRSSTSEPYAGKDIFVRLVDEEAGAPTAVYIKENPGRTSTSTTSAFTSRGRSFPTRSSRRRCPSLPPMDAVLHAGLSAEEAARAMTLPKGFSVKLAAAEPDVVRPIAFALDDRGRLWVAEAHTYPMRAAEGEGQDRILIFEDTDGDGRLDSRKVFIENLNLVSGIEVGFGGVWVGAAPYLLFIPDRGRRGPPGRAAAGAARRMGLPGHPRDAQHVHVGP